MEIVTVDLSDKSYPIYINSKLMDSIPSILSEHNNSGKKLFIISQELIFNLYGGKLYNELLAAGFDVNFINIIEDETAKSIDQYQLIIKKMAALKCDRSTSILALGGGVVGDISGFVAASYMRGIDYYQIPTTLLAMIDSSIGGKTGINIKEGKNIIGAFHQPNAVFIDPSLLISLPKDELVSGLGELIKYGAIRDAKFLDNISIWLNNIDKFPYAIAIEYSCKIKASIVSGDEFESGMRKILNFGHTIGHALEAYLGYGKIKHGESVAIGMKCSSWISKEMGLISNQDYKKFIDIISKLPLPNLKSLNPDELLPYIQIDKKNKNGILHFIVLDGLGNAIETTNVSEGLIAESIKNL